MDIAVRSPGQMGHALRRFRKLRRMTQKDVGDLVVLRQATVSSVEAGEPGTKLGTLAEILKALDLELVVRERRRTTGLVPGDLLP